MIECLQCGREIASPRADGLFFDGQQLTCECGATIQMLVDQDGGHVGRWWCKHGKAPSEDCLECEADEDMRCIADASPECACSRCVAADNRFDLSDENQEAL